MESATKPTSADAGPRPAALSARTLCEAFQRTVAERSEQVALRTSDGALEVTWEQYAHRVRALAAGLHARGLRRGDTLALMLVNRPEFHLVDAAAMHLGATPFSIYNTSAPEQISFLLRDAGNRIVVTERQFVERIAATQVEVDHVILVDAEPDDPASLAALEAQAPADGFDFDAAWRAVAREDVCTLIYTSGTTGPPKGVQLTHANLMAELRAVDSAFSIAPGGRVVSYLPAAHIADRWGSHYSAMALGYTVTSCADPRAMIGCLPEVRPTVFGGVPRVWEKLRSALEAGFAAEPDEQRRAAVAWALEVGLRRVRAEQAGEDPGDELRAEHARADELVCSKLREQLGLDACELFIVAAAPTPAEVIEFYGAIGIRICEMWGMSETSCIATVNPPDGIRIGTVGRPLPGVELRLAGDGEVLVRGEIVMAGYRNQPQLTAEAIDAEGWLHTGDVGELDEAGYLRIVDRKKELIINAAGKNMSPANIEARLKESSPLIGQACVIGDQRPFNVALLVLDPDGADAFAHERGLLGDPLAALAGAEAVLDEIAAAVRRANDRLSRVEQIKRFRVFETDWGPGGDELTPTMKLKRKPIAAKYAEEIEALYE